MYELGVVYRNIRRADPDLVARLGALGTADVAIDDSELVHGQRPFAFSAASRRGYTRRAFAS